MIRIWLRIRGETHRIWIRQNTTSTNTGLVALVTAIGRQIINHNDLRTELGDQLQMVGGEQLHRMEEHSLEAKDGQDGVRGVEVDVGEHVRHDVVDHVL